jgi:hypothetical protein
MTHALVCVRGRFLVNDPAAAGLTLYVAYRGGVVVYLNGKEVARRNLPEGKLTIDSLAEIYPLDAYTTADGKAIDYHAAAKSKDRCDLRIRKLDGLALAPELLRKGVNVLALEVHRAPVNEGFVAVPDRWKAHWAHAGLVSVQLKAGEVAKALDGNK